MNYEETIALVGRLETVRSLLALASHFSLTFYQIDVKSTFLNEELEEEVYVDQPQGFTVAGHEVKVYKLKKALYGLNQALTAWYSRIDTYFHHNAYQRCLAEATLYTKVVRSYYIICLYADDK